MFSSDKWFGSTPSFYNDSALQSLRFENGSSTYLTKTFGSDGTGSGATCTISCWVKRSTISNEDQWFFSAGSSPAYILGFRTNDNLAFGDDDGNPFVTVTDRVFRDTSAWYHIVLRIKTSESANADKYKIYVNGELQATTISGTIADTFLGANLVHYVGRYPTGLAYFDGYMADLNFVDGLALDASYFGELKSGTWIPKEPDVSEYGTNGFRFEFKQTGTGTASASTIGADTSGKNNHFTSYNLSAHDCVSDSPENNFPTINTLHMGSSYSATTTSEGALSFKHSNLAHASAIASMKLPKSGKWYWETLNNSSATNGTNTVGVVVSTYNNSNALSGAGNPFWSNGFGIYGNTGGNFGSAPSVTWDTSGSATTFTANDIIGVAYDADNKDVEWYKNGVKIDYNVTDFDDDGNDLIPASSAYGNPANSGIVFNFGGDSSFAGGKTSGSANAQDANGIGDFYYAPQGLALCSANLPEPTISPSQASQADDHFNTLIYTGNGSARSITGVGFQPDWVWLKGRSGATAHALQDSSRGVTKYLITNSTNGDGTLSDLITSFDSDGFSLGTNANINGNSATYVSWNWKAGGTTPTKTYKVVVVSDSGNKYRFRNSADSATFAQSAVTLDLQEGGTYTFDLSDSSMSGHPFVFSLTSNGTHGGGSEYTTNVTKTGTAGIAGASISITVASGVATLYYYCSNHSGMGGQINTNTTHGSTNFDGSILSVEQANTTAGFSIVTYTGTGSAITVGHGLGNKPEWIITKRRDSTSGFPIYHQDLTSASYYVQLNSTSAQGTGNNVWNQTDPTSTVFTVGTDISVSSGTYVAYVFSEIEGYSKFGSYTGNGSTDGTFVYTGFRPAWVMFKKTSGSQDWQLMDTKRDSINLASKRLEPNNSDAEVNDTSYNNMDILSNGFKLRATGGNTNDSGATYIYMAFAEAPFKYANAR